MMDREEAKTELQDLTKAIEELENRFPIKNPANTKTITALKMAIKALEQDPKIGRWIPVSEKSPLEGQFVLCSIAEYAYTVHRIIIAKYEKNSLYWGEFVNAWMPLPEPYKAESEKKETLREKLEGEERGLG